MKKRIINKMDFFECPNCSYLKKANKLSASDEKKRYDMHKCDEGYRKYMNNVYKMVSQYLKDGRSLDYGCGQIHLLSDILNANNRICDYYDLYYYNEYPNNKYDNIILIEVFEHIDDIYELLERLRKDLNDNGRIIIMTKPIVEDLEHWWYLRDETHISFVNANTFSVLANMLGMKLMVDNSSSIFVLEA